MATIRLTEKSVAALKAPTASGKQELSWDTDLKGFGVLCSGVTRTKTFVAQAALASGLRRRVTIGRCDRLKVAEARDKAKEVLAKMDLGEDPKAKANRLSLRQALDAYIKARTSLKPQSAGGYRDACERHLSDWLQRPLRDITPEMVEARHAKIAEDIKASGRGTGKATANGVMRAFRAIYNFAAERNDDLPKNPSTRLKRVWFKVPRRERMIRFDDLPSFFAAIAELENRVAADYIRFLLFTGLRRREAASLKWSQVDFVAKTFSIPGALTKNGNTLTLPMSDFVSDLLVSRRAIGIEEFVFPANSKSKHIEEPKFAFDSIEEATSIKASPHDLRRTFMTVAESLDISPLAIKALANHAPPRDVTSGYIIMTVERLRRPAQEIADKLKALCSIAITEGANVAQLRRSNV
jgi:integrase